MTPSDNQSTAKTDSAVSPTISAGEAPMSFGAWCKNKGEHDNNYRCLERDGANTVWSACHIGWNAREPEIAQMRDDLIEAEIINKTLEDRLYSSAMEVTALKQELAQARCTISELTISIGRAEGVVSTAKLLLNHKDAELATTREQLDHLSQFKDCHRNNNGIHGHGSAALCVPCENELRQELAQAKERISYLEKRLDVEGIKADAVAWHKDEEGRADKAEAELVQMRDELAAAMGWNEHYTAKLDASESRVAALEGKLGEVKHLRPKGAGLSELS